MGREIHSPLEEDKICDSIKDPIFDHKEVVVQCESEPEEEDDDDYCTTW